MKTNYTPAAEAHQREPRVEERQMSLALLNAMKKAAMLGKLRLDPPDELRSRLANKRRHNFYET